MSNILALVDQTAFLGERATKATNLLQVVWVYDRGIELDGVREFHGNLQRGRLSRRIERSPLPFGRHRWVSPTGQPDLEIASPRPRGEFDTWVEEQSNTPLDPEHGPGWHLAVLPFTDGGAGISFVTSHCLIDGVGLCAVLADAASGRHVSIAWPAAGSRPRWRALREDARQCVRDLPAMGRAVVATARFARHNGGGTSPAPTKFVGRNERVSPPMTTFFVDAREWDARADALGGTSNALLAGIAARLAQRAGRVGADGWVTLALPVNERTPGDTRANAITAVDITVDPATASSDLRPIRTALKRALIRRNETADERFAMLPLSPLLPRWLVRRMAGMALGGPATSGSSNLGELDPAANRPDGTDADSFTMRTLYPGVTIATMHRTGGMLGLLSGRVHGQVFVSVFAYQPGCSNSNDDLRQGISDALKDFSLSATVGWGCPTRV